MSANKINILGIGSDDAALGTLHASLAAASLSTSDDWPAQIQTLFPDWDQARIESVSLRANTLRLLVSTASHDEIDKRQLQALQAAGLDFIRVRTWHGQTDLSTTEYYQAGKKIKAKAFPEPTFDRPEQLLEFIEEDRDAAAAKLISDGVSPAFILEGTTVLQRVLRAELPKAFKACFGAGADLSACWSDRRGAATLICSYDAKTQRLMLASLLAHPEADAARLWCDSRFIHAVCRSPAMLGLLLEMGADPNAQILDAADPALPLGTLLFDSVDAFGDAADVLAVLARAGARSIAPPGMTARTRLERMLRRYRDADAPAGLLADGIDLNQPYTDDGQRVVDFALATADREMAALLLESGARCDHWCASDFFFDKVIPGLFPASETSENAAGNDFILRILGALLAQGLDPNLAINGSFVSEDLDVMLDARGLCALHYRGPILIALVCLACGQGTATRALAVPLAALLLRHGASADADASSRHVSDRFDSARQLPVPFKDAALAFEADGSLRQRLQSAASKAPDAVDIALLDLISASAIR